MSSTPPSLARPGALADQLRSARGSLQAKDLAGLAGWPTSKVSKIEHGRQLPTEDDLDKWADLTGADATTRRHWKIMLAAATESRRDLITQARAGQKALQRQFNEMIARTTRIRVFESTVVPRFMQLPEYSRALLLEGLERLPRRIDDIDAAVAERQLSVSHLFDPRRRFEFIITEPVLSWRFATLDKQVHRAQLEHLLALQKVFAVPDSAPHVRFGIVPMFRKITWLPRTSFHMFDDLAAAEHWIGTNEFVLAEDVDRLHQTMDKMWESACEGDDAGRIIQNAIDRLDHSED